MSSPPTEGLWRLSKFWLSDLRVDIPCKGKDLVSIPVTWDAFKAFVRGSLQGHIGVVRRGAREELRQAENKLTVLETTYTRTRDPLVYFSLQAALWNVLLICTSTTKNVFTTLESADL